MSYIGKEPIVGNFQKCDAITTSSTATYNLTVSSVAVFPETTNNCIVSLNGVIQAPTSAYTISGSQIVFASSLTSSDVIDFILILGSVLSVGTPTDRTVTLAKMATGTDGQIITYDASGNPTAVGPGSDGQVLTSTGAGSPPAFEAIPGGGKIGQVLQTVVSSTFSVNSASMVDLTGITVAITPVASSSKILVFFSVNGSGDPNYAFNIQIVRDSTAIGIGDAASNRMRTTVHLQADTFDTDLRTMTSMYLDSPSTTSATTYKLQGAVENTSHALYINRSEADADSTYVGRTMSQITVMEVLA